MGLPQSTSSKARSSDLILSLFASADNNNNNNNTTTNKTIPSPTDSCINNDMLVSPTVSDRQDQQSTSQTSRLTPRLYEFTAINERIPTRKVTKKTTRQGSPGSSIEPLATTASISIGTSTVSGDSGSGIGSNSVDSSGGSGTANEKVDGEGRPAGKSTTFHPHPLLKYAPTDKHLIFALQYFIIIDMAGAPGNLKPSTESNPSHSSQAAGGGPSTMGSQGQGTVVGHRLFHHNPTKYPTMFLP